MTKISQLVDIGANLAANDEFIIRDVSEAGTPNKKVTSSGFIDYIVAQGTGAGFTQIAAGVGPLARALATSSGATGTLTFSTASATTLIERARIDSSGRLLVGTSTARSNFFNTTLSSIVQTEGANASDSNLTRFTSQVFGTAGTAGPIYILAKHRSNSVGDNTVVQSGDDLGVISFQGADGTEFVGGAQIVAQVDGTPGANDMPGRLVFSTTADGAASPTERMRIDNAGRIGFNYANTTGVINDFGYGGYRSISANTNSTALADQRASWFLRGSLQSTNDEAGNCILLLQDIGGAAVTKGDLIKGYTGTTFNFRVANNGAVQNTPNSYGAISDERLKRDIVDAASQWSDIKNIRVRKFRFKDEIEINSAEYIGVVAQEVEQVSPGLIDQAKTEDGEPNPPTFKSVKYSVLYMKAIKALQEAMERIEALEAKVTALETA